MRRSPRLVAAVLVAVAVGGATSVGAALAADNQISLKKSHSKLAGTWSGRYSGAFAGTFKLHWTQSGSHLRGAIALSKPRGTYSISGSVRGSAINFGAVGAGATYTGSVSGKSMSGSYKSPNGVGKWSAHETS